MTDVDATARDRRPERDLVQERIADAVVSAHTSAPGRTVLTERGNTDAWIASDLLLDCSR